MVQRIPNRLLRKTVRFPWLGTVVYCKKRSALPPILGEVRDDNAIMKHLLARGNEDLKADLEELLKGKEIERKVDEGIVFSTLERNTNSIWSLLLF